jgi:hypothetical protein
MPKPSGVAGTRPTLGRAACRVLTGGSPLDAAPPLGQQARTRSWAVPAATHPVTARAARTDQTVLLAPGILSPRKITIKGAPAAASPLRNAA